MNIGAPKGTSRVLGFRVLGFYGFRVFRVLGFVRDE